MAERTAQNIDSDKCITNETTQVALDMCDNNSSNRILRPCANGNNCTNNNVNLTSKNNDSLRVIELNENVESVNTTKVNHNNNLKTVNDISHINHRPSNLYFNPSRLNEDNQYLINDNTCEYYTDNEFVKSFVTSNNSFSILNLNIRSISRNIGKLKEYLNIIKHNFSVITIQETWFTENTCLDYYNLPNYSLETINRIDCNVGDVGIYISNNIDYKLRTDLNPQNEIFESCFIEINRSNDKNIIIGSIYRYHHHSIHEFNNHLEDVIKKFSSENKLIYLAGDFNIDILKNNEKYIDNFLDLIYSYSLYPLILRPTRINDKSETLIDNILTNDLNNIGGILMFDTSDHLPNFTMKRRRLNQIKMIIIR